jgi:hypothetical protein
MSKTEIIKSSWVVHISHELSLIQQQIWNVLLMNAYDNLATQKIHLLDIRILLDYLGNKKSVAYLKKVIGGICLVESLNLINKTKIKCTTQIFQMLESAVIEDGFCKYSYCPKLLPQLINITSYAKINVVIQSQLRSKHSLTLYEMCTDYLGAQRTITFTLDELKKYFGIAQHEYTVFKHLNYKVIKKSIAEVNSKSNLLIEVKFDTKNGEPVAWFVINKKPYTDFDVKKVISGSAKQQQQKTAQACPFDPYKELKDAGISDAVTQKILCRNTSKEIQNVFHHVQQNVGIIVNKAAWIADYFNKKDEKSFSSHSKPATRTDDFDYQATKRNNLHRAYIEQRVKDIEASLIGEQKIIADRSFEKWFASKKFKHAYMLDRSTNYRLFIEDVLLTQDEKNIDEWAKNQKTNTLQFSLISQ